MECCDPNLNFQELARLIGTKAKTDVACPECGPRCTTKANAKKPKLRIWRVDEGFLTYNCARCYLKGWATRERIDWRKRIPPGLPKRAAPILVPDADQVRRIERGMSIWDGARDIRGTPAVAHFRRRGLEVPEHMSHVLRFSSSLHHEGKTTGGLVALMRDIVTWQPCGIHRTFLSPDGVKLGRKMLGRSKGAAIMLDDYPDVVSGLHIGEGIETCLAARQLGYRPVWAVGSAGAIADFPVLAGIEALNVLGENDRANLDAARALRDRYEPAGCEVWICKPRDGDFNDAIREAV